MLLLGDLISSALSSVGITAESVSFWLGRPCHCPERRDKLNAISRWATMTVSGKLSDAGRHLRRMMGQ